MEVDRRPSDVALNAMAICFDRLGAADRAEKYYREAIAVDPGDATHPFNLSLLLERQDKGVEALRFAEEAVRLRAAEGVYRAWRAVLWRRAGREGEAVAELRRAAAALDALPALDEWREYWRGRCAEELGDRSWKARPRPADVEPSGPSYDASLLPGQLGVLARRGAIGPLASGAWETLRAERVEPPGRRRMDRKAIAMSSVRIEIDEAIAVLLHETNQPVQVAAMEMIVLELYRRGAISSGKAAELLGTTRLAFIQHASKLGIPYLEMTEDEWAAEKAASESL